MTDIVNLETVKPEFASINLNTEANVKKEENIKKESIIKTPIIEEVIEVEESEGSKLFNLCKELNKREFKEISISAISTKSESYEDVLDMSIADSLLGGNITNLADLFKLSNGDINTIIIPLIKEFRAKVVSKLVQYSGEGKKYIVDSWYNINIGEEGKCSAILKSGPRMGKVCGIKCEEGQKLCKRHGIKNIDEIRMCKAVIMNGEKSGERCQEKISPNSSEFCHRHVKKQRKKN